jgi:two-component system chemotaxis sensor kinase CheA
VQIREAILPLAGASIDELGDGKVRVFRLNDGQHEMGYAFAEVLDFAAIDNDVIHAERPGEISGVSLINGEPAELVDAHWLFANHVGAAARVTEQLVCRLPSDDPWMQNMLRPIVEAAGYRVIGEEDESQADLVIASQGEKVDSANAIYLRSEPEPKNKKDDSIYRYDRAGLLMALKSAGAGRGK